MHAPANEDHENIDCSRDERRVDFACKARVEILDVGRAWLFRTSPCANAGWLERVSSGPQAKFSLHEEQHECDLRQGAEPVFSLTVVLI